MLKIILFIIISFIAAIFVIGNYLSVSPYKGSSVNLHDKVFVNSPKTAKGSFARALAWMLKRQPPEWRQQSYTMNTALPKHVEQGIKITPIIHASVLIQMPGLNIITDPIWSERASPFSFAGPKRVYAPPLAITALPPIDIVLLSHNHYDHMDIKTLKQIEKLYSPTFITGLGNKDFLTGLGLKKIVELDWWQSYQNMTFVPAQHFSGRGLFDRNRTLWGGFVIKIDNSYVYFAGDTGYGPFLQEIYQKFGAPKLAILPIGAFMPRDFMRSMHMNPDDAVVAMNDLHAEHAIGIHFDSFARLADEPQFSAKEELLKSLAKLGIAQDRFIAPVPGVTIDL